MTTETQQSEAGETRSLRKILLLLAVLTSPLLCCGITQLLDALPPTWLPGSIDFIVNIFEADAEVENRSGETLYITAINTSYGQPRVIPQNVSFRQRDIPVKPDRSVALTYDSADLPLSGIVVCRTDDDCRLLAVNRSGSSQIDSFESLPELDPNWHAVSRSHPIHNYSSVILLALSLLPVLLLGGWWHLGRRAKKLAGS